MTKTFVKKAKKFNKKINDKTIKNILSHIPHKEKDKIKEKKTNIIPLKQYSKIKNEIRVPNIQKINHKKDKKIQEIKYSIKNKK